MKTKTRAKALQDWRAKKLGYARRSSEADKDFFYELRKKQLPHNLTPEQYEIEVQKIARELGI